jgi:hypothetical protein
MLWQPSIEEFQVKLSPSLPKNVHAQPLYISINFDFITPAHTPLERAEPAKVG